MKEPLTLGDFALWTSILISSVWGANGYGFNQILWIILAVIIFIKIVQTYEK